MTLSIRAIAAATGTGTRQVQEAMREQVCSRTTPDEGVVSDAVAEELVARRGDRSVPVAGGRPSRWQIAGNGQA